ncbi:MAG TPA: LuxR C-terminal-related transcriptional regulator [Actinomycetaceae bacterium]|nr:LuxR C-terminal-related transcriptional regulator [Actinomycetaceae bacterium]
MLHTNLRIIGVPRVPKEHLSRPRLLDRLDARSPLTVLRAPAGSGKSALLAEWAAAQSRVSGVWLSITVDDQERSALWSAVATSIMDAGLARPDSVLASIPYVVDRAADPRRLLVRAFNQLSGPFVLVLDDFEHVTDAAVVDDLCAVARQCAHVSIVVATRVRGPLEEPAIALEVDRVTITGAEFDFTVAETAQLLAAADGDPDGIAPEVIEGIRERSGGRPLIIRALLMESRLEGRTLSDVEHVARLSGNVVRDSVARTLAAGGDLPTFLLRTSVADVITEQSAALLARVPDVAGHMARAEALGIGAWLADRRQPVLRYHALIAELLREEAARHIAAELPQLHAHVARWELAEGVSRAAFRHALQSGDDELASRVAMLRWHDLIGHRDEELRDLLLAIPLARLRHQPFLAGLLAVTLNAEESHRMRAVQYFGVALWGVRYRRSRATAEEKVVLDVLESAALRLTGSSRGLARTRAAAEALDGTDDRLADLAPQIVLLRNQTAVSLFRLGYAGEALTVLDAALEPRAGEVDHPLHHTFSIQAGVLAHVGAMHLAEEMCARADALDWPSGARDDYTGSLYHYARAWQRLEAFDHAGAQRHIDAMRPHLGTLEYQPYFVVLQAFVGAIQAALDPALLDVGEHVAVERVKRRSMQAEREMVVIAGAILQLLAGRLGAARRELAKVTATAGSHAILGAVDLAAGQPEAVLERLATSHRTGQVAPRVAVIIDLVLAATACRLEDETTALEAATRMVAQMTHHRLRLHLVLVPRADLLAVQALLAAHRPQLAEQLGDLADVPELVRPISAPLTLTERELVVLRELVTTPAAADIAAALSVSVNTVKSQLRSVYRKLQVSTREEALAVALREGLLAEQRQ